MAIDRRQAYLLEENGKNMANVKKALRNLWGKNWETTVKIASERNELYSQQTIDESNYLMRRLWMLKEERRGLYKND